MNPITAPIIEKWYKKLNIDSKFNAEFYQALNTISIDPDTNESNYDVDCPDGKKNLLAVLYMCEALEAKYKAAGISEEILLDSLWDVVRWLNIWSEVKGEMYMGEVHWVMRIMRFALFKLGRLQYNIVQVPDDFAKFGLTPGDYMIGIHIPPCGPLNFEDCKESIQMAKEFFAKYFPDAHYTHFSCNSWLLDGTLKEFLPPQSNILKFASLFTIVHNEPADDIIRFMFGWDCTKDHPEKWKVTSGFSQRIKDAILSGKTFYLSRGLFEK